MSLKMGRMTKRNHAKYSRRAYEAGMRGKASVSPIVPLRPDRSTDCTPHDFGGKRAA